MLRLANFSEPVSGCRHYRLEGAVHTTGFAGGFDLEFRGDIGFMPRAPLGAVFRDYSTYRQFLAPSVRPPSTG